MGLRDLKDYILPFILSINLILIAILLLLYFEELDQVTQVVSIIWAAISAVLTKMSDLLKEDSPARLNVLRNIGQTIYIVNIFVFLALLFVFYRIMGETPVIRCLTNEHFKNHEIYFKLDGEPDTVIIGKKDTVYLGFGNNPLIINDKYFEPESLNIPIPLFRIDPVLFNHELQNRTGRFYIQSYPEGSTILISNEAGEKLLRLRPKDQSFVTEPLPLGLRYSFNISKMWYSTHIEDTTLTKKIENIYADMNRIDSGVHLNIPNKNLTDDIRVYLDRKRVINADFIKIDDLGSHTIEVKDFTNFRYCIESKQLQRPMKDILTCVLRDYGGSTVQFISDRYAGKDLYIDGEFRGRLQKNFGVAVWVFDGMRKIEVKGVDPTLKPFDRQFPIEGLYFDLD